MRANRPRFRLMPIFESIYGDKAVSIWRFRISYARLGFILFVSGIPWALLMLRFGVIP